MSRLTIEERLAVCYPVQVSPGIFGIWWQDAARIAKEHAEAEVEAALEEQIEKDERHSKMIAVAEQYLRTVRSAKPETDAEIDQLRTELDILCEPYSDDPAYVAFLRLEREFTFDANKTTRSAPDNLLRAQKQCTDLALMLMRVRLSNTLPTSLADEIDQLLAEGQ